MINTITGFDNTVKFKKDIHVEQDLTIGGTIKLGIGGGAQQPVANRVLINDQNNELKWVSYETIHQMPQSLDDLTITQRLTSRSDSIFNGAVMCNNGITINNRGQFNNGLTVNFYNTSFTFFSI